MNMRLSRFALIAVLLLSTLVVLQMSEGTAAPNAQTPATSCVDEQATQTATPSTPTAASLVTPRRDTHPWVSYRSETVTMDEFEGVPETRTLVISIQQGVTFSPGVMTGDSMIHIDSGTVFVETCGDVQIAVRHVDSDLIKVLSPGTPERLQPGSTIFVPQGGTYRITSEGPQASFTLIGTGSFVERVLCGGAGC